MATVFLNGKFVEQGEALVSAFDAGFQHGIGLFETMLGGARPDGSAWVHRAEDHLDRLAASARELGLSESVRTHALAEAVFATVERSALSRARIRLTMTGGDLGASGPRGAAPGASATHDHLPTVLVVAQPATEYPEPMFDRGVVARIADLRVNPLDASSGHKTLSYWSRLRELQLAGTRGAAEALVFSVTNHLAGGCVSNAMIVRDGRVLTPIARGEEYEVGGSGALPSPVLPGVTRRALLELAREHDIDVERRMLTIDDVLAAEEVMLTNSSWGVLPVVQVERHQIGAGAPGELTRTLRAAWLEEVRVAGEAW